MATTITVGRNVGEHPMDLPTWETFQEEVFGVVHRHAGYVFFRGTGVGRSDWGVEDAFTLVAATPEDTSTLLSELARVGRFYGQEAVAVTEGRTRFI